MRSLVTGVAPMVKARLVVSSWLQWNVRSED